MAEKDLKNMTVEEESFAETLFKYIYILIKHKRVILITTIIVIPIVYFYLKSKQPEFVPRYKTSARIRVMAEGITRKESDSEDLKERISVQDREIKRKVMDLTTLMRSTEVLESATKKALGHVDKGYARSLANPESKTFVIETELNYIDVFFEGDSPEKVVNMTNGIIEATREELLNYKKLMTKEALESLEKQFKETRYDLEQAKLELTKFILENELIPRVLEVKEGETPLTEGVDKLALRLVDIRSEIPQLRDFIQELEGTRESVGDMEMFGIIMEADKTLVDANLLKTFSEQEARLNELLLVNKELHPDVVRARDRLEQTKHLISEEVSSAIYTLKRKEKSLKSQEEKITSLIEKGLSKVMIEYSHLRRNVRIKEELAQKVVDSLQELSLASKLIEASTFTVVDPPLKPEQPFNLYEKKRTSAKYFLFSVIFGLGAGIGLAILIDYFAMTVKDIHEIEQALDYPILGEIPAYEAATKERKKYSLPLKNAPHSVVSEAFRGLRTNIKFRCIGKEIKTLLVTSLVPSEGKTFISANLALAFAQTDKKILVIDCDLRKSALHEYYGLENKKGLTQLLQGKGDIRPVDTEIANLSVLVAGKHPLNPADLLASDAFDKVLAHLRQEYDLVIVDSPPLFAVTDSTILVKKLDAAILNLRANVTPKKAIRRAAKLEKDIQSKIMGVVFNGIEAGGGKYGSYYYYKYDYYGKKDEKKEKKA